MELLSSSFASTLLKNGDPSVVALIETKPTIVRDTTLFSEVFDLLLESSVNNR